MISRRSLKAPNMKISKLLLCSLVANALLFSYIISVVVNRSNGAVQLVANTPKDENAKKAPRVIQKALLFNDEDEASSSQNSLSIEERVRNMAKQDPSEAIRMANSEVDSETRIKLLGLIAHEWVRSDPDSCFIWAMSLTDPREKRNSLANMMPTLAALDVNKGLSLLDQIPKGEIKDSVFFSLVAQMMHKDANFAFTETVKRIDDLGRKDSMANMLVSRMKDKGMMETLRSSIASLPAGDFREAISLNFIRQTASESPEAAMKWWLDNQDLTDKSSAMDELAIAFSKKNPVLGINAADQLSNKKDKENYLKGLGGMALF